MTSIRRKQAGLGARRNTVEQEREQFQRNQEASFRKAINEEEVPLKMKHVRNLIIGTHTDKNGSIFWTLVALSPPLHTDITAWKFCHTLHLVLRDGHPNVIIDSFQHIGRLKLLGEHYQHLPSGYGGLIQKYCDLLMCKLNFHQHYPRFPGTLHVTPEELEAIAENDANNYFEMAVEMLEYMEKILKLYEGVFVSLDPSRANSMTKMGQCRLSPLIPCIQDSSCLYDFIVRILFSLHKIVPTDMLSGHRTRFNQQFKCLNSFYNNTRNLQYFKTLIQVPHLPQVPPNFLIEAELRVHVAPVVVLEEEVPDPAEIQDSVLVDTSEPSPPPVPPHPHPDVVNSHNGSMMEVLAERDSYIDALQEELRETRNAIQTIRSENSYIQEQLKLKINDLESTIAELDSELTAEKQTKESILAQVEAAAASAEAVTKLSDEETRRRLAEEKFGKMKEVYQKLRDEHIALIRLKADLEKTLAEERHLLHEEQDKRKEKEMGVKRLEAQLVEQNLMQKSVQTATQERESIEEQLAAVSQERDEVKEARDSLQRTLEEMNEKMSQRVEELENEHQGYLDEITSLELSVEEKELEVVALKESLIELKEYLEAQMQDMSSERTASQADLKAAIADKDELRNICSSHEATISELKTSVENILDENNKKQTQLQDQLNELQATKDEEIKNLTENYEKLESVLSSVKSENEERSSNLQHELNSALGEKTELQTIRDENEKKICDLKAFIENAAEKSEQEQARLKEQLNDLEESKNDEIRKLTETCETFEVLLTSVKLENEAKEARLLKQLNDMEVSKNEEIKNLTESYEKLEAVLCSTKLKHEDTCTGLGNELSSTIEERDKLRKICISYEEKITVLETLVENILEESHRKQVQLKQQMDHLERNKNEDIKKLTENYEKLETILCSTKLEFEERRNDLQKELNLTIEEKNKLQTICSSHEGKMFELGTTIENTLRESKLKQADLKNRMNDLEKSKNEEIKKLTQNYENLEALLCSVKLENEKRLSNAQNDMENNLDKCIASAVESSVLSIAFSLSHFDSEAHRVIKATPEYTILYKGPIEREIESLFTCFKAYCTDIAEADQMVKSIDQLGALVSSFLLYGKATSHSSPRIEVAENLVTSLEELSKHSTELLEGVRSKSLNEDDVNAFKRMFQRCCDLVSSCEDLSPSVEDMASSIEREMSSMDNAIREAVEKFSRLLEESRAKDTGIQLEVNEGILATCSELMTAVRLLVQRASELQTEIVAAGKGGASPREFYKRNHRWTEGLISGAKTVAIACRALVKAADDVVMGKGKFEEVIVSSKEIAASSMQLVMASRVKAEKDSQRMSNLNMAAKTISTLTGTVVATAESCRDKVIEATTLDFSKLNLHAAKRLEMETLVKVLETEKKLETERSKLAKLRRHHYQLAGELEGWEEKDMRK